MNRLAIVAAGLLAVTGCTYTRPALISPMSLGPKERPLAIAKGETKTSYFLGFHMEGENTFAAAIESAKMSAGVSDATMVNVYGDSEVFCFPACWFPLYRSIQTTLYGTLVTYDGIKTSAPATPKRDGGAF